MKLIPFQSTHFQWIVETTSTLTKDKVYKITEWEESNSRYSFHFLDDSGKERWWSRDAQGIECATFKTNLDNILD